ncbi:MAG: DUF3570 domain-containing protein [Gammaproteobacteria bacterium]|nr:DUF3570 domain-containing protein [Gammaproteobacteria bacterium]
MAVTKRIILIAVLLAQTVNCATAAVLPEDRADVMFHEYDGGGVEINGPSVLVRKSVGKSVSAYAKYYVDTVSSASIDVITTASPYKEERTEIGAGLDYLHEKTKMSLSLTTSSENDYEADTTSVSISQDMFGDLTTVTLGYTKGDNVVGKNGSASFRKDIDLKVYRVSVSQVLTKDMLLSVAFDTMTDQGFLNNPYRRVRYIDAASATGYSYQEEVYPNTRTSNALAFHLRHYLPHRASVYAGYRYFVDTWSIQADTFDLGYVHAHEDNWLFEISYRFYSQSQAEFYSDLFPYFDAQTFMARDKELSSYTDHTISAGVTYEFAKNGFSVFKKGTVNFYISHMIFDYDNFKDLTVQTIPGDEPAYRFTANVYRLFASFWF